MQSSIDTWLYMTIDSCMKYNYLFFTKGTDDSSLRGVLYELIYYAFAKSFATEYSTLLNEQLLALNVYDLNVYDKPWHRPKIQKTSE